MKRVSIDLCSDWQSCILSCVKVGLDVSIKAPNKESSVRAHLVADAIIMWVEDALTHGVCVADECLEVVGDRRLGVVVPHFYKIIISASKHVPSVV